MTDINVVVLAGRLTRDVELHFAESGTAIANIGFVVNNRRKRHGEWVSEPVYIDVKMFGARAEAFERNHGKGSEACFPSCKLIWDQWEGGDGKMKSKLLVHANDWQFIGGKLDDRESLTGVSRSSEVVDPASSKDADDTPF